MAVFLKFMAVYFSYYVHLQMKSSFLPSSRIAVYDNDEGWLTFVDRCVSKCGKFIL